MCHNTVFITQSSTVVGFFFNRSPERVSSLLVSRAIAIRAGREEVETHRCRGAECAQSGAGSPKKDTGVSRWTLTSFSFFDAELDSYFDEPVVQAVCGLCHDKIGVGCFANILQVFDFASNISKVVVVFSKAF